MTSQRNRTISGISDWRQVNESRDWSKMTPAERIGRMSELTVEAFKEAGLYTGDDMDRTIARRLTFQQMRQEDGELDRVLSQRLRK